MSIKTDKFQKCESGLEFSISISNNSNPIENYQDSTLKPRTRQNPFKGIFYHPGLSDHADDSVSNKIAQSDVPVSLDFLDKFESRKIDKNYSCRPTAYQLLGEAMPRLQSFSHEAEYPGNYMKSLEDCQSKQFTEFQNHLMSAGNFVPEESSCSSSSQHTYIPTFDNRFFLRFVQFYQNRQNKKEDDEIAQTHSEPQKKQFYMTKARSLDFKGPKNKEIEINRLIFENDPDLAKQTTLMIKNVPIKFSQLDLLTIINKNFKDKFNYFYLPKDLRTQKGMGFAFINLTLWAYIIDFYLEFNCIKWSEYIQCNSQKYCEISYSNVQGIEEIKLELEDKYAMKKTDENVRPLFYEIESDPNEVEQIIEKYRNDKNLYENKIKQFERIKREMQKQKELQENEMVEKRRKKEEKKKIKNPTIDEVRVNDFIQHQLQAPIKNFGSLQKDCIPKDCIPKKFNMTYQRAPYQLKQQNMGLSKKLEYQLQPIVNCGDGKGALQIRLQENKGFGWKGGSRF